MDGHAAKVDMDNGMGPEFDPFAVEDPELDRYAEFLREEREEDIVRGDLELAGLL